MFQSDVLAMVKLLIAPALAASDSSEGATESDEAGGAVGSGSSLSSPPHELMQTFKKSATAIATTD
jgi:hypothetical protein